MPACATVPGLPFRRTQHNTFAMLCRGCCVRPAAVTVLLAHGLLMNHGGIQSVTASLSLLFSISLFLGAARSDENGWNRNHTVSSNNTLVELKAFGPMALAPVGRESSVAVCASFQCSTSISILAPENTQFFPSPSSSYSRHVAAAHRPLRPLRRPPPSPPPTAVMAMDIPP